MVDAKEQTLLLLANRTEVQLGDMRVDLDVAARLVDLGLVAIDDTTHMIKLTANGVARLKRWKDVRGADRQGGEGVIGRAPLSEADHRGKIYSKPASFPDPKRGADRPYGE
ncbi:hypothetical protein PZ895_10305 [Mesorhizobium sp. YIM 152430]|uniref:hypothetical protein n=1 Tax=Mesorhizobium sp. YIM 152430 TaxID=3031761 RepID=UPI0023DBBD71|nr:hypothetical protein [Mesorhizobium sp. YIM 152430]MDF1600168.1 hypothetical protein [Mesorhizobium sp. YIM 152430]